MKKIFLSMTALALLSLYSCGGNAEMDPAEVEKQVNEAAAPKIAEAEAAANKACEDRVNSDEVKLISDSLINDAQMKAAGAQ